MFDFIAIPFGYVLRFIYEIVSSYGLAIIIFTILSKLLVYPLTLKSKKSMRQMQKLQPKMQDLQKKYSKNKQKYQEEVAKLYQDEKINPMGSCLPMLITLPIMMGLYYVIQQPLTFMMGVSSDVIVKLGGMAGVEVTVDTLRQSEIVIANFVSENFDKVASLSEKLLPVDFNFLGFNLAATPSITDISILTIIPIISGITAFASMQFTQKLQGSSMEGQPAAMKGMIYMMPFMSAYFGIILPAGVSLYWITGNILMIIQEYVMFRHLKKHDEKEEAALEVIRQREADNKRKEMEIKKEEQRKLSKEQQEKKK